MHEPSRQPSRSLVAKFGHALRGIKRGFRGHSSFFVHVFAAAVVVAAALVLGANKIEWCLLVGCITAVFVAELLNTAIEETVRGLTDEYRESLRDALDIASAAVLCTVIGATIIGAVLLFHRLGIILNWWPHLAGS